MRPYGSSIAVILEHRRHRLLLAGDALPQVLVGALDRYPGGAPVDLALSADSEPQLWFNYLSEQTAPWCDPQRQAAKMYTAMHPAQRGDYGITIPFP